MIKYDDKGNVIACITTKEDLDYTNFDKETIDYYDNFLIPSYEQEIERLEEDNKKLKECLGIVSPSRELQEGKYWENNEIERLNKLINYKGLEDIPQYIEDLEVDNKQLKEENQLLNKNYNIINELEKYIEIKMNSFGVCNASDIYYKLQELKGSGNND